MAGDPSKAQPKGTNLQQAFEVAVNTLKKGENKQAASQFGMAYVGAEMALKGNVNSVDESMGANLRQYMWQCAMYRAACLTTFETNKELQCALLSLGCCVTLAQEMQDHAKLLESLGLTASLQNRMSQFEESLKVTERLFKEAKGSGKQDLEQIGMVHRGKALCGLQRFPEAIELLNNAKKMASAAGTKRAEGDACVGLAQTYFASGDKAKARKSANLAMALAEEENDIDRLNLVSQLLSSELNFAS
mmetsp:Transcript_1465/g.2097  ORF Transcript_1465/g.2097 Transcript_1465/m.2097 type:complete len:247 (+) Transcript_1465:50-790(+)